MKRMIAMVGVLCSWTVFAAASQAQFGQPAGFGQGVGRPAMSPYLNLLRGGDPGINYYGLVRPQVATAQAFQQLGTSVVDLQAAASGGNQAPSQTGVAASFMTHRSYFMNNGSNGPQGAYGQYRGGAGGGGMGMGMGMGGAGGGGNAAPPPRR